MTCICTGLVLTLKTTQTNLQKFVFGVGFKPLKQTMATRPCVTRAKVSANRGLAVTGRGKQSSPCGQRHPARTGKKCPALHSPPPGNVAYDLLATDLI